MPINAQLAPEFYWVQFTDKKNNQYSLDAPEEFLSERALMRRNRLNIEPDSLDLPVSQVYLDSLSAFNLSVHCYSKWKNGAVIKSSDELLIDTLHNIGFIAKPLRNQAVEGKSAQRITEKLIVKARTVVQSDDLFIQIDQLNGRTLHEKGLKGKGVRIALLDSGYENFDVMGVFKHLRDGNNLIAVRDFVNDGKPIYRSHNHGSLILSTMAAIAEEPFPATAPEAEYVLVRTENADSEYVIEEYFWLCGAEFADSIGADLINSSLGYTEFEDKSQSYTYADMDGKTAISSIAANIAAKKGILVVTSAGNSGNKTWFHIGAPGDAEDVFCIGAVDGNSTVAEFSSRGPSADGRVKPDFAARGEKSYFYNTNNKLSQGDGTSFSSPIFAGVLACLRQAYPEASVSEIYNAVLASGDRCTKPDNDYGYGLVNFEKAFERLRIYQGHDDITYLNVFPNPISQNSKLLLYLPWLETEKEAVFYLYNQLGKQFSTKVVLVGSGANEIPIADMFQYAERGYYILTVNVENRVYNISIAL